jgi:hypothetical protein
MLMPLSEVTQPPAATIGKTNRLAPECRKASVGEMMKTNIAEGLVTPIEESNKGFKLLQKFGFQAGRGLGKEGQGRSEPIPIAISAGESKSGKNTVMRHEGLGTQAAAERIQIQSRERLQAKDAMQETLRGDYRQRTSEVTKSRRDLGHLYEAEKTIMHFDEIHEVPRHALWPTLREGSQPSNSMHSRNGALGCQSGRHEGDELEEYDPFRASEHIESYTGDLDNEVDRYRAEDRDDDKTEGTAERLELCLDYLRQKYFHCLFCGFAYNDAEELAAQCPGGACDDH